MARFKVGDRVKATRNGIGAPVEGVISRVRRNGSYDIAFEDGINQSNIPKINVRAIEAKQNLVAFGVS
jgi:hypothetical protein